MSNQERESYSYLQVDRPILSGADDFLECVNDIGVRVIGTIGSAAIAENVLVAEENAIETQHRTINHPKVETYSPRELRMILLRRAVPSKMSPTFNFTHKAAQFNERRGAKSQSKRYRRSSTGSIVDQLNAVGRGQGLERVDSRIICDKVVDISDPVFGHALALSPRSGDGTTFTLTRQARKSEQELKIMSEKIAYSSEAWTPIVPFASLPENITNAEYTKFVELIDEQLKPAIRLIMGGVEAYSGSAVGQSI